MKVFLEGLALAVVMAFGIAVLDGPAWAAFGLALLTFFIHNHYDQPPDEAGKR